MSIGLFNPFARSPSVPSQQRSVVNHPNLLAYEMQYFYIDLNVIMDCFHREDS